MLQIQSELDRAVALYKRQKPARVLEIGCWDGGTLREWLTQGEPDLVVAVDPDHRNQAAYEDWIGTATLVIGHGLSQSDEMKTLIRTHAPYDWVFVDGDHGYDNVRRDVDLCLPLVDPGGVLLLHDITPPAGWNTYGPREVLDELVAAGHRTEVFDVPERYDWSAGIGVVYL